MPEKTALGETRPLLVVQRRSPRCRMTIVAILSFLAAGSLLANFYSSWTHGFGRGGEQGQDDESEEWGWSDVRWSMRGFSAAFAMLTWRSGETA